MTPHDALARFFGHAGFRGRQAEVIDHVLAGRHALVIMPTGGGKSLCYQIPSLVLADRQAEDGRAMLAKDRSANGTSASVGRAGLIMRSNRRNRSGWMRPGRGGAAE